MQNFRQFISKLVVCLFLSVAFPHISNAQKILGAEITYQYLDGDSFQVNLKTYLLCDSNANSFAPGKLVVKPDKSSGFTVDFKSDGNGGTDVTPVSKTTCTPCNTKNCAFGYGVKAYTYNSIVKLGAYTDCNFIFGWQGKNRAINGKGIYLEATLNKCLYPYANGSHNSPFFTAAPTFIACLDNCTTWSFGAASNETSDSLDYKLVKARIAKDTAYSYPTGYDSLKPMSVSTYQFNYPCVGFPLERETGIVNFEPTKEEDAIVAIKTIQWAKDKNGTPRQIGSIMRDFQLTVMDCDSNSLPIISGINGGKQTSMDYCANQPKCFTIHTYDKDTLTDSVTLSSNISQVFPGATLQIEKGKKFPKATFCWTPSQSDVRTYPYSFTMYAEDNNSPVNGRTQNIFSIKVNPAPEAIHSSIFGKCDVSLQSLPGKITKISKYEWRGISRDGMNSFKLEGNPVRISGKPATYDFTHTVTSVNGCKTTYTDTLTVPDVYLWVKLPADTSVCINTVMDITAERHNGKGDVNYMWSTDYGNWVKNKNKISINITQDTVILVYVQDSLKCFDIDTIRIKAQKPPKPELGPDRRECSIAGQFIELSNLDTLIKPKSVQWFKTNGSTGGNTPLSTSAKLHVKDSGKYWVLITDSVGCTGTDSINILFNPTIDVERKTIKACHGDSVTLVGGTTSVNAAWKWEDIRYMHLGLPPVSTQQNYKLLAVSNGQIFTLKYKVTVTQNINGLLCKDIDTISLVIYPLPAVKAGKLVPQCADNDTYNLNQAINSPSGGRWTYSKNRNDLIMANVVSPKNLGPGNHYLYYWYNDSITNCQGYDSTLLVIDSLPEVNAGKDTLLCNTNTIISFSGTPVGGSWTMLDPNTKGFSSSPNASFDASKSGTGKFGFIYSYQDTASARCSNQDTIYVTIYTSLIAKGGQYPVQCNSANDLELVGNPVKGTWNTNLTGVLSQDTAGKYHFSPAKAGVGNHKLWYTVSHPQGACPKTDTIYIQVDSNCVWPGDANLDKTADYLDILDIALGYSASGSPRINASTDWIPQLSKDWSNSLSSGINYKHLDTNGDSMIDATDTFAIAKNYGKTHLKNEEPQLAGNPNDPPLYFQFNKKYYLAGDTVKAALYVGSADKPVNNIYGLGLKHFFANPYMVNETYNFSWNCEMLCGAKDNFQLYRQFNDKGTGEGSMIRTDKLTTSKPFGKVADVEFILKDSTFSYPSGGTNISIDILKSRLIDMNRNEIPVYTKSDAVKVYRTQNEVVGIKENHNLKSEINIYPNPANNLVYIDGGEQRFNEITMANLLGETVAFSNLQTSKTSINIAHLSAGIYFIRVRSGNQFSQHKLVITK